MNKNSRLLTVKKSNLCRQDEVELPFSMNGERRIDDGGTELGRFAVVPRENPAESFFPLYLALVRRCEINIKNLVSDLFSLLRAMIVVDSTGDE